MYSTFSYLCTLPGVINPFEVFPTPVERPGNPGILVRGAVPQAVGWYTGILNGRVSWPGREAPWSFPAAVGGLGVDSAGLCIWAKDIGCQGEATSLGMSCRSPDRHRTQKERKQTCYRGSKDKWMGTLPPVRKDIREKREKQGSALV